jgi:hypothetical protein
LPVMLIWSSPGQSKSSGQRAAEGAMELAPCGTSPRTLSTADVPDHAAGIREATVRPE